MKAIKDFTLCKYKTLLESVKAGGFSIQTVEQFFTTPQAKVFIIRHDVDSWPVNALQMAVLEAELGIITTYYFRNSHLSFKPGIVQKIAALGHEIGYHYEDLTSSRGNYSKAIKSFESNLEFLRKFYPVRTIAMHGKPLSAWDNLELWKKYDYEKYDIIGEPYLTINFDEVLYLTDTGNCWDGNQYSIRDTVESCYNYPIHTTDDLISHLQQKKLPEQIMLNIHPARWNNNLIKWLVRYYILSLPKYQTKKWVKIWRNK